MERVSDVELPRLIEGLPLTPSQAKGLTSYLRRDNSWQQRARLLQTTFGLQHEELALDPKYPWWIEKTTNPDHFETGGFLTDVIASEARRATQTAAMEPSRLISKDRLGRCLLSSQPLCFNAFGELSAPNREPQATKVLQRLWPDLVGEVTRIRYEHSPHRGAYGPTGTYSAFDVFIDVLTPEQEPGFIGIEVKYHEDMTEAPPKDEPSTKKGPAARLTALDEAAHRVGKKDRSEILGQPGWQVWLDHALALAMLDADVQAKHDCFPAYQRGAFVMLSPRSNEAVQSTYADYVTRIAPTGVAPDTLRFCEFEDFVAACQTALPDEEWPQDLERRYLDGESEAALV